MVVTLTFSSAFQRTFMVVYSKHDTNNLHLSCHGRRKKGTKVQRGERTFSFLLKMVPTKQQTKEGKRIT